MTGDDLADLYALAHDPDAEWMAQALCAETDPEAFFPDEGQRPDAGKKICRRCEVRAECLAYALDHDETGVWGGTTEKERRRMRARQAVAA
ncbi:WhiB family transcriptional regulator [Microbispora sp. NPDC088329]|uniref:WhiB family transcriptional regulator n=1 Tax=Microbispora sp. NPDC088329 TaxID=3154869 RepID=UPI003435249E